MDFEELKIKYPADIMCGEASFKNNFKRYQDRILEKYRVHLVKRGRGKSTGYFIEEEEYFLNRQAFSDDEQKDSESHALARTDFYLTNDEFFCFLVLLFAPMGAFRGTFQIFAAYAGVDYNEKIDEALTSLAQKGYINMVQENVKGYYLIGVQRSIEQDINKATRENMNVDLYAIRRCIEVAKKNNKRSWIPLLKLWSGIAELNGEVSTIKELAYITGLSEKQVSRYGKLLRDEGLLVQKPIYIEQGTNEIKSIGSERILSVNFDLDKLSGKQD